MKKLSLIHNRLFYLFFGFFSLSSGAQTHLTNEEYKIINEIFETEINNISDNTIYIYEKTIFDKGWSHYFEDIKEIFKNVGVPTKISDQALKMKLDQQILSSLHSAILKLKPYQLSQKKVNNSIKLTSDFDTAKSLSRGVFRISKPIIIENKFAVLKKVSINESPIFILEKIGGEWEIIYTFYDWYVMH